MNRHCNADNFPNREPWMTIPWVHPGTRRRLILESLVTEIRLSPWASPEDTEEVKLWVNNKTFACRVNPSSITGPLTPTPDEFRKNCP